LSTPEAIACFYACPLSKTIADEEQLLIDYGRALARDAKHIPDELFDRLRLTFSEETIVVATAMGVFMIANNVFNDALQVEPEEKA